VRQVKSKQKIEQKLTIIIPCYNEEKTIELVLNKVLSIKEVSQVIVVDDCSTDNSFRIISSFKDKRVCSIRNERNLGKGSSIQRAQPLVTGNITIIQDADLEYDPTEYAKLTLPINLGLADVVYGSRFQTSSMRRIVYFWHYLGNKILTTISNSFTNLNLSDMETCHKAIKSELFKSINLKEKRFGFEPEITSKLANRRARFYEVSIAYYGRTYEEGKKIGVKDGFRAVWCAFRYCRFFDRESRSYRRRLK
jgi:glycosyltransferase involved in cell wall biosynthesis